MNSESVRFASGTNIMLALWQVFSAFILGYTNSAVATGNAVFVGVVILGLASYRMLRPAGPRWPSWIILLLGAWLVVSPLALEITPVAAAMWNNITVGIAVLFFTGIGLLAAYAPET